ncbi:hypothetical protein EYF80_004808 [Liparis tanakae]|uniref:Uncharacterized protein n=1 Tax=Liparis tanakae TaxID=230148 RepID=A0A4Z2J5H0_9TELE|nr:hypothetical protein EYF80_004808 [Liparis tanakae]
MRFTLNGGERRSEPFHPESSRLTATLRSGRSLRDRWEIFLNCSGGTDGSLPQPRRDSDEGEGVGGTRASAGCEAEADGREMSAAWSWTSASLTRAPAAV